MGQVGGFFAEKAAKGISRSGEAAIFSAVNKKLSFHYRIDHFPHTQAVSAYQFGGIGQAEGETEMITGEADGGGEEIHRIVRMADVFGQLFWQGVGEAVGKRTV